MAVALASRRPLEALWRLSCDTRGVALLNELMGAATHRKALREQVTAMAASARRIQIEALRTLAPQYGLDERFPPELLAAAIQGTALLVARERALGIDTDRGLAGSAVEAIIDELEARRDLNVSSN
jgi:hypothetical protein